MASLFSLHEIMLTDPNYMDWLKNLQNRFVSEMNSDILDISDPRLVSNNKKAKEVPMGIIYDKFRHWENNCKNYLASLKWV